MKKCLLIIFCLLSVQLSARENSGDFLLWRLSGMYPKEIAWYEIVTHFYAAALTDPEIAVRRDRLNYRYYVLVVNITSPNDKKAQALADLLLPQAYDDGGYTLEVQVHHQGKRLFPNPFPTEVKAAEALFETALKGNKYFIGIKDAEGALYAQFYLVFKDETIKFFNDDLFDLNGWGYDAPPPAFRDLFSLPGRNICIGTGIL